jgi:hypothetical protein
MIERYAGMTALQASKEGSRLIAKAAKDGNWIAILEPLAELRAIMMRNLEKENAA